MLVLGDDDKLAEALALRLGQRGISSERVQPSSDAETSETVGSKRWRAVVVLTRDDILALRLSLLSSHLCPGLPVWTTIFDATVTRELRRTVPGITILSPSALVGAELARHCMEAGARAIGPLHSGVRVVDDALRLLVGAGVGLLVALVVQAVSGIVALHDGVVGALYFSTGTVATVSAEPGAAASPAWFKLVAAADTVAALLLVAVFTAALVRRLSQPRLTALVGPRAAPRRGHVLLVGFGQVGFRLAQDLRARGVPVLAVERDAEAPCLRLARRAGIPVSIRRGEDRDTLELLGIRRCSVVAAVTSSDLVNVEVGLAATDLSPGVAVVLRLGDGEVAAETDSLLHLGRICDAHAIVADRLIEELIGGVGADDAAPITGAP